MAALDAAWCIENASVVLASEENAMDSEKKIKLLEAQVAMLTRAAKQVLSDIDDDGVAERHDMGVLALRTAVELGPANEFQSAILCARRVHTKFGADCDWSEYRDLGDALSEFDNWPAAR